MRVPAVDLRPSLDDVADSLRAAMERVVASGNFVLGGEVEAFERSFAAFCGGNHAVGVSSGTAALHLALLAAGIGEGDEVVVPAHTAVATWMAVSQTGATIVPVEPVADTYNIDCERVAAAVGAKTRAIVAVHLYGQPADMDPLAAIAAEHGLTLVEDASQAHGASYKGGRVGALGDVAAFSLYPTKNLGALGDAGIVVTEDAALADRVRRLRSSGDSAEIGYNSRLDELQAAVLGVKLEHLDRWNEQRSSTAHAYTAGLAEHPRLRLPAVPDWAMPVWHQFVIRHDDRDRVRGDLQRAGVGTLVHYPMPAHRTGAYAPLGLGPLPVTEELASTVLSLPMGLHVDKAAADLVVEVLHDVA